MSAKPKTIPVLVTVHRTPCVAVIDKRSQTLTVIFDTGVRSEFPNVRFAPKQKRKLH
jgi:hypothetical protein